VLCLGKDLFLNLVQNVCSAAEDTLTNLFLLLTEILISCLYSLFKLLIFFLKLYDSVVELLCCRFYLVFQYRVDLFLNVKVNLTWV